jgi:hypothetical protein
MKDTLSMQIKLHSTPKSSKITRARYTKDTLLSTINSPSIEKRIMSAARKKFNQRKGLSTFYEHGGWVLYRVTDNYYSTYSVVDAEGVGAIDGFDFELIDENEY